MHVSVRSISNTVSGNYRDEAGAARREQTRRGHSRSSGLFAIEILFGFAGSSGVVKSIRRVGPSLSYFTSSVLRPIVYVPSPDSGSFGQSGYTSWSRLTQSLRPRSVKRPSRVKRITDLEPSAHVIA